MSLYDDVVLAVTAAGGYKEGKIYSVKPDGLGDYPYFTVVRATTPNRINKDGDTEVVSINTPVIDWTTGSPLLIVSEVGEITLTTPSNATKVVITINGVDTEYNNVFPTLVLPVGSISKIIATDGGVVYDLLRDYLIRITEATIYAPQNLYKTEQGSRDLKAVYEFLDDEGLLAGTELLFLSNAGLVLRTENGLQYIAKGFDASENDNDLVNNTGTAQPRLVGGIAPNSKPAAANQSGESRSFSHTSITVSGTYTTVKMMDTGGKYEFTYTEVTSGTLSTVTWTGNLRIYMIYAGTLSASERTSLETQLYSLYPEIESVDIGTQTWATRNFEAVATPLGNVIANVTDNADWANATNLYDAAYAAHVGTTAEKEYAGLKAAAMWCYYNNSADNGAIYGKLYNWYAAKLLDLDMQTAGFGYQITQDADWDDLEPNELDNIIKYTGEDYWEEGNEGTNETGLTVLGSGFRYLDGEFVEQKETAIFWNSDETIEDKRIGGNIRIKQV